MTAYGVAGWAPLTACCVAVIGAQARGEWRAARHADGRVDRRALRRVVRRAVVRAVVAAAVAALVTPWRGENDVPGGGRLLPAALLVFGTWWWSWGTAPRRG